MGVKSNWNFSSALLYSILGVKSITPLITSADIAYCSAADVSTWPLSADLSLSSMKHDTGEPAVTSVAEHCTLDVKGLISICLTDTVFGLALPARRSLPR